MVLEANEKPVMKREMSSIDVVALLCAIVS